MRVVITDEAKADLVGIGEYIRPHNPARAASFVNELMTDAARLPICLAPFHWFRVMRATGLGVILIGIT